MPTFGQRSLAKLNAMGSTQEVILIVRCWPQADHENEVWRGEVEDVASGEKTAFQGMDRLISLIETLLQVRR